MSATVSFIQEPFEYNPVNAPMWVVATSSSWQDPSFNYVFNLFTYDRLNVNNFTDLGIYRIPPRPTGEGIFDLHKIIRSGISNEYDVTTSDISTGTSSLLPVIDNSCMSKFRYKYGYEESITPLTFSSVFAYTSGSQSLIGLSFSFSTGVLPGDIINVLMSPTSSNTYYNGYSIVNSLSGNNVLLGTQFTGLTESGIGGQINYIQRYTGTGSYMFALNGTRQYYDPNINGISNTNGYTDFYKNNNYIFGSGSNFLTTYNGYKDIFGSDIDCVSYNQYETVSIICKTQSSYSVSLTTYDINMNQTGGYTSSNYSILSDYQLYNLGVGTSNLNISFGVSFSNVSYYKVTINSGTQSASVYRKVVKNPSPFSNYRLMFLNRLGGYDYYNFNYDSTFSIDINRKKFNKTLDWNYNVGDRGESILTTSTNTKTIINTDWISESDYLYLQELVTSPNVYVIKEKWSVVNGVNTVTDINKLPIIVEDSSWTQKTQLRDKLFNLTITFSYSYPINLQTN